MLSWRIECINSILKKNNSSFLYSTESEVERDLRKCIVKDSYTEDELDILKESINNKRKLDKYEIGMVVSKIITIVSGAVNLGIILFGPSNMFNIVATAVCFVLFMIDHFALNVYSDYKTVTKTPILALGYEICSDTLEEICILYNKQNDYPIIEMKYEGEEAKVYYALKTFKVVENPHRQDNTASIDAKKCTIYL